MTLNIMFVDDDLNILAAVSRKMRVQPWKIITAKSPVAALEYAKNTEIDVIISDFRMPEMSGVDFLAEIRHLQPNAMRIILTGCVAQVPASPLVNDAGVFRVLEKPCSVKRLKDSIIDALRQKGLMNRLIAEAGTENEVQRRMLFELEQLYPGISSLERDEKGAVVLSVNELERKY